MSRPPLNGSKTHPLTQHAYDALHSLTRGPMPSQQVNAGVVNRLMREDLVEEVSLPSPYATHKGKLLAHLKITDAGRIALEKRADK